MENHPIPQDVTGFQFKLIGNMTIKQFGYLAIGIILAWIFLQLPFNIIIKLPLASIFAFFGISLAFLPIGGRPMDLMIGNFIKALFRPTQFIYEKSGPPIFSQNRTIVIKEQPAATPALQTASLPVAQPAISKPQVKTPTAMQRILGRSIGIISAPDFPNIITGMTKDPRGNPLSNILVEVKDNEGNPVRAFKTNEVGRFMSATPLISGTYVVEFEDPKSLNKFKTVTVNVAGQIIQPIIATSIDTREELRRSLFSTN